MLWGALDMKPGHFYDEILKTNFYLFIGWDDKKLIQYFERYFKYTPDLSTVNGKAIILKCDESEIICTWVRKTDKKRTMSHFLSDLAHECVHACNMSMGRVGYRVDLDNDEMQAYYVGLLMQKSLEYYFRGKNK